MFGAFHSLSPRGRGLRDEGGGGLRGVGGGRRTFLGRTDCLAVASQREKKMDIDFTAADLVKLASRHVL